GMDFAGCYFQIDTVKDLFVLNRGVQVFDAEHL
ncbi:MAG: hypothetical protein ACI85S_001936, partial [Pseudohongiellaceae bacterium]